ncbi:MAG: PEP/pyruvate-binding domain-containing protein [Bacteroidales bacterium]
MTTETIHKYNKQYATDTYDFKEISYENLMQKRIINVLLICSNYDAFMLEEDGRINEKIFLEYTSKNLRYPPQFTQASSAEEAYRLLKEKEFDLVITMLNVGQTDCFEMAKNVKKRYPRIPIVVLTHFSREVSLKLRNEDLSSIDYVFSWLGNAGLLLAIIKLLEDRMNADHDIEEVGVQGILLVEDSVRYYSSYLPTIYQVIFDQTNELMTEGLNEHRKTLRMRARPKILLAKTYEEALSFYNKYRDNLLGIISDISYTRKGQRDNQAGVRLAKHIRKKNSHIPILLQSSQKWNATINKDIDVSFIDKYSKTLLIELKHYIKENYGFGDFVFKDPDTGMEVGRANKLHSLQVKITNVDAKVLEYHVSNNHFSRWLKARALFSIANIFAEKSRDDFGGIEEIRNYLIDTIANYRRTKGRGIIASHLDEYAVFTRLGDGQLGGKARGLAFIDSVINRYKIMHEWDTVTLSIPRTVVLTTDVFDEFMEENELYDFALSDVSDEEVLERFVESRSPSGMKGHIKDIVDFFKSPLAVRSSSLLEDSHYQPFAGVYATYMISNNHPDDLVRMEQLEQAVKSVYASVFFKESKAYIEATSNVIDEEKMAVVIQELSGRSYGNMFYPTISGVARSVNFYPIEPEKYEDGVANIAFGLGKIIVEGGQSLRFSPKYPQKALQLSNTEISLRDTQRAFYSLNMDPGQFRPDIDDAINLNKTRIRQIKGQSSLKYVASTYDYEDEIIREGLYDQGSMVINFANVLKNQSFPLASIVETLLDIGQREMNNQVEIEFSANLDVPKGNNRHFHFLQIRPIVETQENNRIKISGYNREDALIICDNALGNGIIDSCYDFIYVKPDAFDSAYTKEIAEMISQLNSQFTGKENGYILTGPGRWGSNDPWLGIPVKWAQISGARLIVESGLKHFQIDPSQGTHFFQNLTSFNIGYFTINPYFNEGYYDVDYLDKQEAVYENRFIRHVRFKNPMVVKIDGRKKEGIVLKPGK